MANLDSRLAALESRANALRFSPAERQHAWYLMVWQARLKLVGADDLPPEPTPEWLADMTLAMAGEDIGRFRGKLHARFPDWQAQLRALSDMEVYALNYDWATWARQEQLLPGNGQVCLETFLAGPKATLLALFNCTAGK